MILKIIIPVLILILIFALTYYIVGELIERSKRDE